MSYEIRYRDKYTGKQEVHTYRGNDAGAEGWARALSHDHECKAEAVRIADGPYDSSGKVTHLITVGDDQKS
jgi:hypothetical protein